VSAEDLIPTTSTTTTKATATQTEAATATSARGSVAAAATAATKTAGTAAAVSSAAAVASAAPNTAVCCPSSDYKLTHRPTRTQLAGATCRSALSLVAQSPPSSSSEVVF
jgi:hypothetical protein